MAVIRVESLRDRPAWVPVLALWAYYEWSIPMRRGWEATVDRYRPTDDLLPVTFVASLDGAPAGMASLRTTDSHDFLPGVSPWICNVYVAPGARGQGVAARLCESLIDAAHRMGFADLHLAAGMKSGSLYHRLGFTNVAEVEYFGPRHVLRLDLTAPQERSK
ncbi:GNAT family N-acetyltransferase [Tabrizicola sp.]|uniref:GNAT family N-acetyltransferase n=1 Tax=Tabrizicola sp. TaxID=2005166 RepID=UPI002FDCBCFC